MTECIDTIPISRPLEGFATWMFRGVLWGARLGDRVLSTVVIAALEARERSAQRQMLRSLDARMLRDLGLTLADVEREVRKPFWKA